METAYLRIQVAPKRTWTPQHDIADSDDYFQYTAACRDGGSLTGDNPAAYVGDSAVPHAVRTRTLARRPSASFGPALSTPLDIGPCVDMVTRAPSSWRPCGLLFSVSTRRRVVDGLACTRNCRILCFSTRKSRTSCASQPLALRGVTERLLEQADSGTVVATGTRPFSTQLRTVYLELGKASWKE